MYSMSIPALLVLLLSSAQAHASRPQLHNDFKAAKGKLDAEIQGFVEAVKECNPPLKKDEIINGFAGADKADSALNLLKLLESNVAKRVSKGGEACDAAAREALTGLTSDIADYRQGNETALKKEIYVRTLLGARELRVGKMVSSEKELAGCKKALAYIEKDGSLKKSDEALQRSLANLANAYSDSGKCAMKKAAFPSMRGLKDVADRSEEYQVADLPLEPGTVPAQ